MATGVLIPAEGGEGGMSRVALLKAPQPQALKPQGNNPPGDKVNRHRRPQAPTHRRHRRPPGTDAPRHQIPLTPQAPAEGGEPHVRMALPRQHCKAWLLGLEGNCRGLCGDAAGHRVGPAAGGDGVVVVERSQRHLLAGLCGKQGQG